MDREKYGCSELWAIMAHTERASQRPPPCCDQCHSDQPDVLGHKPELIHCVIEGKRYALCCAFATYALEHGDKHIEVDMG